MVYEIQKQALMQKYFGNETEVKEEDSKMSASKRSTIIVEHLRRQQMLDLISVGKRLQGKL